MSVIRFLPRRRLLGLAASGLATCGLATCGLATLGLATLGVTGLPAAASAATIDPRLAENPALAALARKHPARARAMLAEIDKRLAAPSRPEMRSNADLDAWTQSTLRDNPLLLGIFSHDPAAALDMLRRIKEAGAR